MKISFKAKIKTSRWDDNTIARRYLKFPALTQAHYSQSEARAHPKYGNLANWDGFPSILRSAACKAGVRKNAAGCWIELPPTAELPPTITVDETGFLALVTVDIG